ncbi:hypothetical protein XENORESO_003187 [Xenotaenia resolanae]|uniref:Uncharacterized protein n=1 Tax=Xenotaenia resolanae TaxID=208358 RepID=A0ABV0VXB1_9TELE
MEDRDLGNITMLSECELGSWAPVKYKVQNVSHCHQVLTGDMSNPFSPLSAKTFVTQCYFILTFPFSDEGSNPCGNPTKCLKNVLVNRITLHRTKQMNSDITMCHYEFTETKKSQLFLTAIQLH